MEVYLCSSMMVDCSSMVIDVEGVTERRDVPWGWIGARGAGTAAPCPAQELQGPSAPCRAQELQGPSALCRGRSWRGRQRARVPPRAGAGIRRAGVRMREGDGEGQGGRRHKP